MLSKKATEVKELVKEIFPYCTLIEEHFVKFKGQKLFFDFYIKEFQILIEVQGEQHFEYTPHFHGDREGFLSSRRRDNLKIEYCELERLALVEVAFNEEINKKKLLRKFSKALEKL